jgi:hypothetical protein
MADSVIDTSVVSMANGQIAGRRQGNALDRRLLAIEDVAYGRRRMRYNPRLLVEYRRIVRIYRNDVIELFFTALTERAVFVPRNTLSRQDNAKARKCKWPGHDQHLLAAAVGGIQPTIFVTEADLHACAASVLAYFAVHVEQLC